MSRSRADFRCRREAYLRLANDAAADVPISSLDTSGLKLRGELIYVRTTIRGFKDKTVGLAWTAYDARSQERMGSPSLSDQPAYRISLQAPTDSSVAQLWVPPLCEEGKYLVRVELRDDQGVVLDVADSPRFDSLTGKAACGGG